MASGGFLLGGADGIDPHVTDLDHPKPEAREERE
jgi:hypothetical protein